MATKKNPSKKIQKKNTAAKKTTSVKTKPIKKNAAVKKADKKVSAKKKVEPAKKKAVKKKTIVPAKKKVKQKPVKKKQVDKKKPATKKPQTKKVVQKKKSEKKIIEKKISKKTTPASPAKSAEKNKLGAKDIKILRDALMEKKLSLLASIESEISRFKGDAHQAADVMDLSSDSHEEDLTLQIAEYNTRALEQINKSLEHLDNGTYGTCEECECFIGLKRLQALPFATLCRNCKEKQEQASGAENQSYTGLSYSQDETVEFSLYDEDDSE